MPELRLIRAADPSAGALTERSDDELVALACAGLRPAFAALVARHAERVVAACARFVNDAQLGRELAQDTWVLVWRGRDKYRAGGGFVPWLITIARNRCRNHLRQSKRTEAEREPVSDELGTSPGQLDGMLVEERRRRVRGALLELPEPLREALLLRYGEGLPYERMTSVVGAGESTLRSRVHHGLKALKHKLEEKS